MAEKSLTDLQGKVVTPLGKVMPVMRGEYDPGETYTLLDIVSYGGSSWTPAHELSGVTPEAGDDWVLVAEKGEKGDPGEITSGVASFNGRVGEVVPEAGDYAVENIDGLQDALGELSEAIPTDIQQFLAAHPVGAYYWSSSATSPASLFGGTWTQITDRFVLAAGSTYTVGGTGGAASVTSGGSSAPNTGGTAISIEQMPSHSHSVPEQIVWNGHADVLNFQDIGNLSGYTLKAGTNNQGENRLTVKEHSTNASGSGATHTHTMAHTHTVVTLPPYIVAYCWRRTA